MALDGLFNDGKKTVFAAFSHFFEGVKGCFCCAPECIQLIITTLAKWLKTRVFSAKEFSVRNYSILVAFEMLNIASVVSLFCLHFSVKQSARNQLFCKLFLRRRRRCFPKRKTFSCIFV